MIIDDNMKNCLRLAMNDESLDFPQTVQAGFRLYAESFGVIEVEDDEDGEELVESAFNFVADTVLENLMLKGFVEPSAVDENGEILYGLTEQGKAYHRSMQDED